MKGILNTRELWIILNGFYFLKVVYLAISLNVSSVFGISPGQCLTLIIWSNKEPMDPLSYEVSDSIVVDLIWDACDYVCK